MKPKSFLFVFFFLLLKIFSCAQYCDTFSFQKIYWNAGVHESTAGSIFFNAAGNLYFIGKTESAINHSNEVWMMKTSENGSITWSKTIGMNGDENINGIRRTADGGFIVVGSTNSLSKFNQGWIVKIDSDAIVQWSLILGTKYSSLAQIVQLNDGGYAASGTLYTDFSGDSSGHVKTVNKSTNLILRIDKNGNMIWWRSFRYSRSEGLKGVIQLKDGALVVTGLSNISGNSYVIKLNQDNGSMIWMNEYSNTGTIFSPRAILQKDGTIHLHSGNKVFFLTDNGNFYDGRQIELNSKNLNLDNTQVSDIGTLSGTTEIYDANLYPQHAPVVFAVKDDSVVVWAHQYKPDATNLQRFYNATIHKQSIYISGEFVKDNLSDNMQDDRATYLIKADTNGYTLCSDTFNVSFKIKTIPYPSSVSHGWMDEGTLQPQFIHPKTETIQSKTQVDCAIESCCKAVSSNTIVSLCTGDSYKLPNDSIVRTSGLYTLNYHTSRGCDSTLKYNVNFKKFFTVSLGDDTCLTNNQPVIFSIPKDSGTTYRWQDGSAGNNFTAALPGKYWVTATSSCNISRDTVNVNALCSLPVFLPSAFTPNNDGLNDIFKPLNLSGQRLISLSIYNRYGSKIFLSEDPGKGWDGTYKGTNQPIGTYIYMIRYFDFGGILHSFRGTVVLIR